MGTHTWWKENCIQCGEKGTVEVYDAPFSLQWARKCSKCGWDDGKNYYETEENIIKLLTKEELEELKEKNSKVKTFREELEALERANVL